ncbi:peptidoglycan DD-metalloendopeptidase family protein [Paralcaligenes sp. KSB-10]|uniref:peptidoglycan DD-metalloendopeptidase family protein n=1 Tax=Paralcaligenes sp. KSB-10 TaxID=2901142 RepID=UPI00351CE8FE
MFKKGTINTPSQTGMRPVRHRTSAYIRNSFLFVALGLFATAAALAVVDPNNGTTELPLIHAARQTLALPEPFPLPIGDFDTPFISETQIRPGDTLSALLQRLRIQEPRLQQFLAHDKNARAIYKLQPGRTLQAALDKDGRLVWLRYNHTPGTNENGHFVSKWLEVKPDGKGQFAAAERSEAADTQIRVAEGVISSSLFGATDAADIPDAITLQMTDILGSKIDFMQDIRRGDRFRIIYESYSHDGMEVGAGRILALEFINRDHPYEAVWFDPKDSSGAYYDFSGHSLKGAFLRTALKFTRISSTFGMRMHPLHRTWTGHQGVDYAAPKGTPIHSTSDGVVEFMGQKNGYGNVIIIKHGKHYSTLYAHQSRFASGLKQGETVEQGQLIGYVGATGWATGPHLHYEFRVDNRPIDPLSVNLPIAHTLEGPELKTFEHSVASYREHIHLLAELQSQQHVASR